MNLLQHFSQRGRGTKPGNIIVLALMIAGSVLIAGVAIGWVVARQTQQDVASSLSTEASTTKINSETSANTFTANNENVNTSQQTNTVSTDEVSSCPDAGACNADAKIYCAEEFAGTNIQASWKLDLVRCLYDEHADDISVECRASLECRQSLNENLISACQEDQRKFCRGVRPSPGSEPLVDCLEGHFNELSPECASAWTAHDLAKPTR